MLWLRTITIVLYFPLHAGMEKVVVDSVDNVVMLHSTMWDQCITGHIDRAIVDGKVCNISESIPH